MNNDDENKYADELSISYAILLERLSRIGLMALTILFVIYITGVIDPHIQMDQLDKHWCKPA